MGSKTDNLFFSTNKKIWDFNISRVKLKTPAIAQTLVCIELCGTQKQKYQFISLTHKDLILLVEVSKGCQKKEKITYSS